MRSALLLLSALVLPACKEDEGIEYVQLNSDDDTVEVLVGVAELLDPVAIDLTSSTGEVVIGTAEVDPGGGPVGTEHDVVVVINDDYQDKVDRVTVRAASPDLGADVVDEFEMTQDSFDEGYYKLSIETVGEEGVERTDVLTVRVWDAVEVAGETEDEQTAEE